MELIHFNCTVLDILENNTLYLWLLLDVDVTDHNSPGDSENHDTRTYSKQAQLGVPVSLLDSNSGSRTQWVSSLGVKAVVDVVKVRHSRLREITFQGNRVGVLPNNGTDS